MGHRGGHWHHMMEGDEDYQRQTSDRELAGRLLRYTWRVKTKVLFLTMIVMATTALSLAPPYLFSFAIDNYITNLDFAGLKILAVAFVAVALSTFGVEYAHRYLISWLGARLEFDMRMDVFRHLQRLSLGYYAKKEVGSIVSRVTNDIDKIIELVSSGVIEVIADVATLVGIIAIMLWMSLRLSLITFSVIPLIFVFMYLWGKRVRRVYRETRKTIASVSAKIEESVSGMKEIQSFSRERETRREFEETNISNLQANVEAGRVMSAFMPAVSLFSAIGNFLVFWFGGLSVMQGTLTVGVLFAFMSYIGRFFWPIQSLSQFWNDVQSALAAAERVFQILDTEVAIENKPDAVILPTIEGRVTYEDMTF
ncbi:MAG: ABC transporter ATP-binding protein, partial [Candidatus Bathyarchaeia archaeon]